MNDSNFTAALGMVADHIGDMKAQMAALRASVETLITIQKKALVDAGHPKEKVEAEFSRIWDTHHKTASVEIRGSVGPADGDMSLRGDSGVN